MENQRRAKKHPAAKCSRWLHRCGHRFLERCVRHQPGNWLLPFPDSGGAPSISQGVFSLCCPTQVGQSPHHLWTSISFPAPVFYPGPHHPCYHPGFLASLINRNWQKARQEIQASLSRGPCCIETTKNRQQVPLLAHSPRWGQAGPYVGWGQAVSRAWARGSLDDLPSQQVVPRAGGRQRTLLSLLTPAFAPGSSEVAVVFLLCFVFWSFLIFLSTISPSCTFISGPLYICCIFLPEERVSRCKHSRRGSRGTGSSPRVWTILQLLFVCSFRWYQDYQTNRQSHRYGFLPKSKIFI